MKLAVCLSGHLRKFTQTYQSLFSNLLKGHEYDIFIHTWDRMGYVSAYKGDSTVDLTSRYVSQAENIYKPKKMIVEDSTFVQELIKQGNEYAPHLRNEPKHVGHMASMFYKIWACNELRKMHQLQTGAQYDWVIRCRPDLLFHGATSLPADRTPGRVYIPKHLSGHGWLTDQFAIALPDDMDLYCSVYFQIPDYFRARKEFRPEMLMDDCFKKLGLQPVMWDCHLNILR